MLTAALMQSMSLQHLLAAAHTELDALTSTPLEHELLRRLEDRLPYEDQAETFLALADEYGVTAADLRAVLESNPASAKDMASMLSALSDEDIHGPEQVKALIKTSTEFRNLAIDAAYTFTRLAALAETTTAEE